MAILSVRHLRTNFSTDDGTVRAVRDVSFDVDEGEILGIAGESGSGKSVSMFSIMGLLPPSATVESGEILFEGRDISPLAFSDEHAYEHAMQGIRGNDMAMVFQDPMTFLNPVLKIGTQLIEPIQNHMHLPKQEAQERAAELLRDVGITDPVKRLKQYPGELSGGMRQRIIIAIALACSPKLIIADEPTTALDVTIQAQVLELISEIRDRTNAAVILITHDLGVVAQTCDRVAIMYGGKIVEEGAVDDIFYRPVHPYTKGLLGCIAHDDNRGRLAPIAGSPPDLLQPPAGCPFVDRCTAAMRVCRDRMPPQFDCSDGHVASCWLTWKEELDERRDPIR